MLLPLTGTFMFRALVQKLCSRTSEWQCQSCIPPGATLFFLEISFLVATWQQPRPMHGVIANFLLVVNF